MERAGRFLKRLNGKSSSMAGSQLLTGRWISHWLSNRLIGVCPYRPFVSASDQRCFAILVGGESGSIKFQPRSSNVRALKRLP